MSARKRDHKKTEEELFTDREKFRDVFWNTLITNSENPVDSKCLTFYGNGGVGKTWLLKELDREVNAESHDNKDKYRTIYYDFETSTDIVVSLAHIRTKIYQKDPDYNMPYFDLALKRYIEITGSDIEVDFKTKHGENAHKIDTLFDVLSYIPGIGTVSKVYEMIKLGEKVADILMGKLKYKFTEKESIEKELVEILSRTTGDDLKELLVDYFFEDLCNGERDYSFIFFLDTFEKLTRDKQASNADTREKILGLIEDNIDYTVWILASRDKVFNDDSREYLVGDLSEADTIEYLKKAINLQMDTQESEEFAKRIFEITTGTPVFLDIFVEHYRRNRTNDINAYKDITKEKLVERYIKYLEDNEKTSLEIMSAMAYWKDKDYREVFDIVHNNSFSQYDRAYQSLINTNMIIKEGENRKFLHETVRKAIYDYDGYTVQNRQNTLDAIIELFEMRSKEKDVDAVYYKERIIQFLKHRKENGENLSEDQIKKICEAIKVINDPLRGISITHTNDFIDILEEQIFNDDNSTILSTKAKLLRYSGKYKDALKTYEKAYEKITEIIEEDNRESLGILYGIVRCYRSLGENKKALENNISVYEKSKEVLGDSDLDTIKAHSSLVACYMLCEKYEDALVNSKQVYEKSKETLGEGSKETLTALHYMAGCYRKLKRYEEALETNKQVYDKRIVLLGEKDPETLTSLNYVGKCYEGLKRYEEALNTHKEVYEKRKEVLKENHPDTLTSLSNIAQSYRKLGEYEEALKIHKEVYEKRKEILPNDHITTLKSYGSIARCYYDLGKYKEALDIYEYLGEKLMTAQGENELFKKEIKEMVKKLNEILK